MPALEKLSLGHCSSPQYTVDWVSELAAAIHSPLHFPRLCCLDIQGVLSDVRNIRGCTALFPLEGSKPSLWAVVLGAQAP
eukprot:812405-Rhodomonas_salina.1